MDNNLQFSLFRGVHDTQPQAVTLDELVAMMRSDQSVRDLTEKHRYALSVGDKQSAKRYKDMMLSFSMAAQFLGGRRYEHITAHTNVSMSDMDDVAPALMAEALARIRADEHTLLAYTTMSGHGLRVLFRYEMEGMESIPVTKQGRELYKQAFEHGNAYYEALTGLPTDRQCKNTNRISTIAHDDNLYYNPEAVPFIVKPEEKKNVGRPRKPRKAEDVEVAVTASVEAQGVRYEEGSYNAYVSRTGYEMNRYGVPEEQCVKWAVNRFDDYNATEVEAIIRSCYKQTAEHGTATPLRQPSRSRYATVGDMEQFLDDTIKVRYNTIVSQPEFYYLDADSYPLRPSGKPSALLGETKVSFVATDAHPASAPLKRDSADSPITEGATTEVTEKNCPHFKGDERREQSERSGGGQEKSLTPWTLLTGNDLNSLWRRMSKQTGLTLDPNQLRNLLNSDYSPQYNPFEEYIRSLPQWDGVTDHIAGVAAMVTVRGEHDYFARCFKKWFVGFIAGLFDPEEVNHEILVLIGHQGKYKSTFFRYLLPPELRCYSTLKLMNESVSKDELFKLAQMALVCLEEIDHMKQRELNQLKALTTMSTINERRAYGKYHEHLKHIASFCATGNNLHYLTDRTGNRRFLSFEVIGIEVPQQHAYDYAGLYAQAYHLWRTGYRYWLDDEENAELDRHNRQFEEPCLEEELILTYLRRPEGDETGEFLTAARIIELIGQYVRTRLSPKRVAMAMNRLAFEQRRVKDVRGWLAVTLSGDDIKNNQRMNAHRSSPL